MGPPWSKAPRARGHHSSSCSLSPLYHHLSGICPLPLYFLFWGCVLLSPPDPISVSRSHDSYQSPESTPFTMFSNKAPLPPPSPLQTDSPISTRGPIFSP